ncbi:GIY-YIG nuclease family protein [bacterium]|nr:GIY-YIG nuclease family protein [bacterium]
MGILISLIHPPIRKRAKSFTARNNADRLVYYERFESIFNAIAREKQLKGWKRKRKDELVISENPRWNDLAVSSLGLQSL